MKRIASSLVLATAAFASVATSMVLPWLLEDSAEIPTVEVPTGTQGFAITGEARGTDHAGGRFDIHLELSGSPLNLVDPLVTATVISEADPTVRETRLLSVSASVRQTVDLQVPAWETCGGRRALPQGSRPCSARHPPSDPDPRPSTRGTATAPPSRPSPDPVVLSRREIAEHATR